MKINKKYLIGIVVIILLVIGFSLSKDDSADNQKIVAILPMTGTSAQHGEWAKRGIEMAIRDQKSSVQLIIEDSIADPKNALSIVNKYKSDESVSGIFALGSPVAMAIAPIANEISVPTFSIVSAPAYSTPNDFTFRINGTTEIEMGAIKKLIESEGGKRIAIVYLENDYGKGLYQTAKKTFATSTIVAEEGFQITSTDLRTQIAKIKATDPDAIFVAAWAKEVGLAVKQIRELGLDAPIYCASACDNPDVVNVSGVYSEGLKIVSPSAKVSEDFGAKYFAEFNEKPNFVTLRNYNAATVLIQAIKACDSGDTECIRKEVSQNKSFDQFGDLSDEYQVSEVVGGKIVVK